MNENLFSSSYGTDLDQDDTWQIIGSFFNQYGLVKQQIRSYDTFILHQLSTIICETGEIEIHRNELHESIGDNQNIISKALIQFDNVKVSHLNDKSSKKRILFPQDCRLRKLTYGLKIISQVKISTITQEPNSSKEITAEIDNTSCVIGEIPLMVRSGYCRLRNDPNNPTECHFDPGGYFIVKGSEKVIIGQEHQIVNRPIIYFQKSRPKYDLIATMRSQPLSCAKISQPFEVFIVAPSAENTSPIIECHLPKMTDTIPLPILFRALGIIHDKEILEYVCYDLDDKELLDVFRPTIEKFSNLNTRDLCFEHISRHCSLPGEEISSRKKRLNNLFNHLLLPHIGEKDENKTSKAFYIGYVCNLLVQTYLQRRPQDDRDHYSNKRIDLVGPLIASVFGQLFEQETKAMRIKIQKSAEPDFNDFSLENYTSDWNILSRGLQYCISTGNWNSKRQAVSAKVGVSQMLNRLTYISTLSNLRRVTTPIERDAKLTRPRQLHNTHWGYICPVETPEGGATGLVKNFAMMCLVTSSSDTTVLNQILEHNDVRSISEISPQNLRGQTKVFINGAWYGVTSNPEDVQISLLNNRRQGKIKYDISIVHKVADKEIYIWADGGRVTRPLLIIDKETHRICLNHEEYHRLIDEWLLTEDGKKILQDYIAMGYDEEEARVHAGKDSRFKFLLNRGMVEFLDVDEEENSMIAMYPRVLNEPDSNIQQYTHCEIHPSMILSVCGSLIPFPDHNQSPRNVYQCAMGKQAIGLYATNFLQRMDSSCHVLWYPQKPLVCTRAMEYLHFKEMPAGINCCIAVACYTGYNQEDSLMLNQSSIDRGLFRSFYFRTYTDTAKFEQEEFRKPNENEVRDMKFGSKNDLDDDDGIVKVGVRVTDESCLIGKVQKVDTTTTEAREWTDQSTNVRSCETGIVDLVLRTECDDGTSLVRVRTRTIRTPQIGDKFSSRHGQKGTCGMTYRQEDMPFTREGIVPDIIMNPHALPSRMTIGQLIECLLGKVEAIIGGEGDATPFGDLTVQKISDQLRSLGYESHGNEVMYNGRTGKKLTGRIYFGPTFYQRLKHMVADKMHARSTGPYTLILRQPVEGRARNGGLRFGEMERDCLIAHGASGVIRDRLFSNSDRFQVTVCKNCGLIAYTKSDGTSVCKLCGSEAKFSQVELPYAFKLVLQELMSLCINPRIMVKE